MVLKEIHGVPDKDIPQDLWDRAACVIVVPGLKKAAFVIGGEYGKGLMSCRHEARWSAPIFMQVGKGSWGLQIGAQSIDLVLLVMNTSGMEKMLRNKVSLGAEASVAAGPVGRDARAATDAQMKAEILSYSRTQGLFAGINLSGGVVRPDVDDNVDLYGKSIDAERRRDGRHREGAGRDRRLHGRAQTREVITGFRVRRPPGRRGRAESRAWSLGRSPSSAASSLTKLSAMLVSFRSAVFSSSSVSSKIAPTSV